MCVRFRTGKKLHDKISRKNLCFGHEIRHPADTILQALPEVVRTRVSAACPEAENCQHTLAGSVALRRSSCWSRSPLMLQPLAEASLTRCCSFPQKRPNLCAKRPTVHGDRPRCCRCFFRTGIVRGGVGELAKLLAAMSAMFLASAEKLLFLTGELGGQARERGARVEHWGAGWRAGASATIARACEPSNRRASWQCQNPLDWGEPVFERGDGRRIKM